MEAHGATILNLVLRINFVLVFQVVLPFVFPRFSRPFSAVAAYVFGFVGLRIFAGGYGLAP